MADTQARARPPNIDLSAVNANRSTSPLEQWSTPRSPLKSPGSSSRPLRTDEEEEEEETRVIQQAPASPVKIQTPLTEHPRASSATIENGGIKMRSSDNLADLEPRDSRDDLPYTNRPTSQPYRGTHVRNLSTPMLEPSDPLDRFDFPFQNHAQRAGTPTIQVEGDEISAIQETSALQYHHADPSAGKTKKKRVDSKISLGTVGTVHSSSSEGHTASSIGDQSQGSPRSPTEAEKTTRRQSQMPRPASHYGLNSGLAIRGRSLSPQEMMRDSPRPTSTFGRNLSASPGLSEGRPMSTIDLLNIPYSQQVAHQALALDHAKLQGAVGANASLLDTKKTLDMYRANVRKTNDNAIQYEFAIFMISAVQDASVRQQDGVGDSLANPSYRKELIKEARTILQRLADRGYAYAQYYLGDGYASGFFNNGKADKDKAFGYFIAAGKHGHAEAAYRAALCYEFGWGSRRDVAKAVQYYRSAASKGHPGAAVRLGKACLTSDMGLHGRYREGVKWLKRAAESADAQHNSAPYELGLLHINGYGADVFKDEAYAAQLLTQSAELGHAEANLRMGEVYEHGLLGCPRDPALSIHFYTAAAQAEIPEAMMALCAWYMVGAEPVLAKNEAEAYEWARKAATLSFAKAEYAIGYFTEMGIGCRRDPLEANTWYSRAAEQGDDRAKSRLAIIREAESGQAEPRNLKPDRKALRRKKSSQSGDPERKDDKDCVVM